LAQENRQKKLAELKTAAVTDEKKGAQLQKIQYLEALDKAKGEKRKDDVSLLRKSIKRKEQEKKRSARQWKVRAREREIE
jgi:hypothetical protein